MKAIVLMSTFNGSKYVVEQLLSILDQLPPDGRLMIRDDGSTDDTVARISSLLDPRIELNSGSNIGFGASFLTLLADTPVDADLVMFSDQDDVWLPGKIQRVWDQLRTFGNTPALYCSAQRLVDESLEVIGTSPRWPRGPSFRGAISENIVTGCTAGLNRAAVSLLATGGIPPEVRFHDWWMYLVVSAFGRVVVDEEPSLLYRQHGNNVIGRGAGWLGRHIQIVRFLARNDWVAILLAQVQAFWRAYGDRLTVCQKNLLEHHFQLCERPPLPRWSLVFSPARWRQYRGQELFFRVLLASHALKRQWIQVIGPKRRLMK